jgi:hypothetical protein
MDGRIIQHEQREQGWLRCRHAARQLQDATRGVFGEEAALAGDGTELDITVVGSSRSVDRLLSRPAAAQG